MVTLIASLLQVAAAPEEEENGDPFNCFESAEVPLAWALALLVAVLTVARGRIVAFSVS